MKFIRSRYLLANYRRLQRHLHELRGADYVAVSDVPVQQRFKRNLFDQSAASRLFGVHKRQRYSNLRRNHHNGDDIGSQEEHQHRRVSRTLSDVIYRQMRRPFQGDEAYARYMEKIKQKYQNYVKNILGHNNVRPLNYSSENGRDLSSGLANTTSESHVGRVTLNSRGHIDSSPLSNEDDHSRHDFHMNHEQDNHNHFDSNIFTISRPQYQHRPTQQQQQVYNFNYRPSKKQKDAELHHQPVYTHHQAFYNNTYHSLNGGHGGSVPHIFDQNQFSVFSHQHHHGGRPVPPMSDISSKSLRSNMTDMIAKLTAQIVRRKRSADDDAADTTGMSSGSTGQQRVGGRKNGRRNLNATAASTVAGVVGSSTATIVDTLPTAGTAAVPVIEVDRDLDELKRGKPKSPCEVSYIHFISLASDLNTFILV